MKTHKIKIILALALLTVTLTGCFSVDNNFRSVRNQVLKSMDGQFSRDMEFGVGAATLRLGGMGINFAESDPALHDMMKKIDRVQIGVYNCREDGNANINYTALKKLTDDLRDVDYQFIVRSYNEDELTAVMVKKDSDYGINEMFVVAYSGDDLIMTQIFGDLDGLIEIAIRDNGFKFDVAQN